MLLCAHMGQQDSRRSTTYPKPFAQRPGMPQPSVRQGQWSSDKPGSGNRILGGSGGHSRDRRTTAGQDSRCAREGGEGDRGVKPSHEMHPANNKHCPYLSLSKCIITSSTPKCVRSCRGEPRFYPAVYSCVSWANSSNKQTSNHKRCAMTVLLLGGHQRSHPGPRHCDCFARVRCTAQRTRTAGGMQKLNGML